MSMNNEMALVWWTEDNRTSIVKLSDVNEKDRRVGCVSRIKYNRRKYLGQIVQISSDMRLLKRAEDYFLIDVNRRLTSKCNRKQIAVLSKIPSDATSECADVAITERSTRSSKLNQTEKPLADNTTRMNLRSRNYVENLPSATDGEESNYCLASSEATIETRRNVMSIESDTATVKNMMPFKCEIVDEANTTGHIVHAEDEGCHADIRCAEDLVCAEDLIEDDRRKDAREKEDADSWSNGNLNEFEFMKPYRGNPHCVNMLRDLLHYLQGTSVKSKNNSHCGALFPVYDSMFIDLLPIPSEVAKVSLHEKSGVYIPKIAERRIISKAVTIQRSISDGSGRINDESIGPTTMVRLILCELYGRDQMAEASAFGTNGTKAIPRYVLRAIYYYTRRNFPTDDLSWTWFIRIVNRKCGEIARELRHKYRKARMLTKDTYDGDCNKGPFERDPSSRREIFGRSDINGDVAINIEPFAQNNIDLSLAEGNILSMLDSSMQLDGQQTGYRAAESIVEKSQCVDAQLIYPEETISSTVLIESSVDRERPFLPSYQQLRGEPFKCDSLISHYSQYPYNSFESDNNYSTNDFSAINCKESYNTSVWQQL